MKTKLWLPILAGLWLSTVEVLACEACAARALLVCSPISLAFKLVVAVLVTSGRMKPGRTLAVVAGYMVLGYLGWMLTNNDFHVPLPLPKAIYQFFWQFSVLDMVLLAGPSHVLPAGCRARAWFFARPNRFAGRLCPALRLQLDQLTKTPCSLAGVGRGAYPLSAIGRQRRYAE